MQAEEQIPKQIQTLFNKGFAAFERGNFEVAIDLLGRCLEFSPGFLRARRFLRAAQIERVQKSGLSGLAGRYLNVLKGTPAYLKTALLLKRRQPDKALVMAEKMLFAAPVHFPFVRLFADVAVLADQLDAAILTAEAALKHDPDNPEPSRLLGELHSRAGNFSAAKDCFEKLLSLVPNDKDGLKLLKDAMARETMRSGWEETETSGVGARELVRDQDSTRLLDLQGKAVKTASDIETLIEQTRSKIETEPNNLNYYRSLARLFMEQKDFAQAIETLEKAREINRTDPELDRSLAQAKLSFFDHRIKNARQEGDDEAVGKLEQERAQFAFDDLVERVERYPNDPRLRFDLGVQYYIHDAVDDAIQQFQIAQRSPRDRIEALAYLARCFRRKGQDDMAVAQLEQALDIMPSMDDQKKEVLYQLGEIAEAAGDKERAAGFFKEIYRVDIGFRDVADKVEKNYAGG